MPCCAEIPTWCATPRQCWSGAACAGIADASRVTSRWKRIGSRGTAGRSSAFHLEQLDVEDQRRVGWYDSASAPAAVRHVRGDDQSSLPTDFHARNTLVPAANDAALPEKKSERNLAITRRVEFCALVIGCVGIVNPPSVVNNDGYAFCRFSAAPNLRIDLLQIGHLGTHLA